jgi:hypothetical protein
MGDVARSQGGSWAPGISVEPSLGIGQSSGGLGGPSQSMSDAMVCNLLATTRIAGALLFGPLTAGSCHATDPVNVQLTFASPLHACRLQRARPVAAARAVPLARAASGADDRT